MYKPSPDVPVGTWDKAYRDMLGLLPGLSTLRPRDGTINRMRNTANSPSAAKHSGSKATAINSINIQNRNQAAQPNGHHGITALHLNSWLHAITSCSGVLTPARPHVKLLRKDQDI